MQSTEVQAREEIRDLLMRYTAATDRFDLPGLAACFADDGELRTPAGPPMVGPDDIASGLAAQVLPDTGRPAPRYVHHHVSSTAICDVTTDSAAATSYFTVFTDAGVDHWGRYRDRFVTGADGRWLFASRRISVDGFAENSRMRPAAD